MGKMTTRQLTLEEYYEIKRLMLEGFTYKEAVYDKDTKKFLGYKDKKFRPNFKAALALTLEANLGLRISDIVRLKVSSFKGNKLQITEKKTGELQYRNINPELHSIIMEYAMENGLTKDSYIFNIGTKAVQKQLRIVCTYLGLLNVGTHSFRKMYAIMQYENNGNDIRLVKDLLNHSSTAITERYVVLNQKKIDMASESHFIG